MYELPDYYKKKVQLVKQLLSQSKFKSKKQVFEYEKIKDKIIILENTFNNN